MTKRLSAILAAATLGLSAAAYAQTSTAPTQPPAAAPAAPSSGSGSSVNTPADRTGAATNKQMSEAEVRQALEKQGYTRISDVKKKGDHFEAKGMKDGKAVSLNVDAKSGKVVAR